MPGSFIIIVLIIKIKCKYVCKVCQCMHYHISFNLSNTAAFAVEEVITGKCHVPGFVRSLQMASASVLIIQSHKTSLNHLFHLLTLNCFELCMCFSCGVNFIIYFVILKPVSRESKRDSIFNMFITHYKIMI